MCKIKDLEGAKTHLKAAIELSATPPENPTGLQALVNLAQTHITACEYEEAISVYLRLVNRLEGANIATRAARVRLDAANTVLMTLSDGFMPVSEAQRIAARAMTILAPSIDVLKASDMEAAVSRVEDTCKKILDIDRKAI